MSRQKKLRAIEAFALKLREARGLQTPVDVRGYIDRLGGSIMPLPDARNSMIENTGKISFTFWVPTGDETTARYSLAYMLGHLFLHMGYLVDQEKWNRWTVFRDSHFRDTTAVREYEAEHFAMSLMMPHSEFLTMCQKHTTDGEVSPKPIAEHFGMPEGVVIVRGMRMGIFS